ncbi:MAG: tRNA preQ1(34) S-adenosylmethionine ribosyltransferase-isomerase QueA, partial [Chloroflexota bacterium]
MTTKLSDFDYFLPPDQIAQTPLEPRDASRLMVVEREKRSIAHTNFTQIIDYFQPGDLLVVNQTRVIPVRLYAKKVPTGGKVEVLLLNQRDELTWEAWVGGSRMTEGKRFELENELEGKIVAVLEGAGRLVRFEQPINQLLNQVGSIPLPPYIHTKLDNPERYQTVYAKAPGSAAAPTAGLHFTPELLDSLQAKGVSVASVTLHVGLDTFAPVVEENVLEHEIHTEWCEMTEKTAQKVNSTKSNGGRVIVVGTTSVRVIESASRNTQDGQLVSPYSGATDLFILPGYKFKAVDAMLTNFHLPKSTLLMMVSAFADRELIFQAYQTAIQEEYRFYSFG